MSDLHLVFSRRPDGVSHAEYATWYLRHLAEILDAPGWVRARGYDLQAPDTATGPPLHWLAMYEVQGGMPAAQAALQAQIDAGRMYYTPWFAEIRFAFWDLVPIGGDAADIALAADLELVFDAPDAGFALRNHAVTLAAPQPYTALAVTRAGDIADPAAYRATAATPIVRETPEPIRP
jgi:hypothetical protein